MGWHSRTKSNHFTIYNQLAEELAGILGIDPWLISSMHRSCDDVNFKEKKRIEKLAQYVDELIENLRKKYAEYGIDEDPYCYIKADNGTYGIAVWPVFSGQEVLEINKKERNKMSMLKGAVRTQKVMIQEGIKTNDRINGKIAEPMIYLIGGEVVGNLFRANEMRDEKISLNATGANFFDLRNLEENQLTLGLEKNKIPEVYSLIARLAALASSIENSK
jgi:glutamate--cysteine ligase